eukprot:SAG31_NODE_1585_length_7821_cov_5.615903_6_plen_40_part_00
MYTLGKFSIENIISDLNLLNVVREPRLPAIQLTLEPERG